jgi:hypothetical protein
VERPQPQARVRLEAGDETLRMASVRCPGGSLHGMVLGRMTACQGTADNAEGERESGSEGEKIPLQEHLPTDFAG